MTVGTCACCISLTVTFVISARDLIQSNLFRILWKQFKDR